MRRERKAQRKQLRLPLPFLQLPLPFLPRRLRHRHILSRPNRMPIRRTGRWTAILANGRRVHRKSTLRRRTSVVPKSKRPMKQRRNHLFPVKLQRLLQILLATGLSGRHRCLPGRCAVISLHRPLLLLSAIRAFGPFVQSQKTLMIENKMTPNRLPHLASEDQSLDGMSLPFRTSQYRVKRLLFLESSDIFVFKDTPLFIIVDSQGNVTACNVFHMAVVSGLFARNMYI